MNTFMIEMTLPSVLTPEFLSLIREQRSMVDRLVLAGIIRSYALAYDRSQLWIIVAADSESEAIQILSGLPLTPFMKTLIHPLAFHQSGVTLFPHPTLN